MTACWRHLVMLSYDIDPQILQPLVPAGTELDTHNGRCYVSLVGFLFEGSRLRGLPIPLHGRFEELNLRFYVKRTVRDETRRAVVFVKELVPKRAVALVARAVYNEPYRAVRMSHELGFNGLGEATSAAYGWNHKGRPSEIGVEVDSAYTLPDTGSVEEFIAEHYWGYTRLGDAKTAEYEVAHPQWRVAKASRAWAELDANSMYGKRFAECLANEPASAFLAEGSAVEVFPRVVLQGSDLQ